MKKLRFSTFAQVLTVLLCAAMIWTGLYVLDTRANVVWDLTPDLLTELSEGTIQTMDGLDESVHLHLVFKAETESDLRWMLETLAGSYVRTGHAVTDTIDPVTEPGKIRGYAESGKSISEGSVIVASADESRYVVVPVNDLYAYQMTSSGSYTITGLSAEQKITSAIRTVTGGERKQVWFLTGHDEAGMSACSYLVSRLQSDNYEVAETTLTQSELQGGDILLILSPARDLTQEEKAALDAFLLEGGRLLMACDASLDLTTNALSQPQRRTYPCPLKAHCCGCEQQTGLVDEFASVPDARYQPRQRRAQQYAGKPARDFARRTGYFRPGDPAFRL